MLNKNKTAKTSEAYLKLDNCLLAVILQGGQHNPVCKVKYSKGM